MTSHTNVSINVWLEEVMATAVFSVSLSILACCFFLPSPCTSEYVCVCVAIN